MKIILIEQVIYWPVAALTARSEARYRLKITISADLTCIRRPFRGGEVQSEYCHALCYRITRVACLPDGKKIEDTITHLDRIHERDRQTHRQTPHDDIGRARIASRGKNYAEDTD